MSTEPRSRAWVEVDPAALRRNLATIRETAGAGAQVVPMVKADAYGLGLTGVVRTLESEHPWGYGVATVPEGLAVRALGVERPILVLSPAPRDVIRAGVQAGLTFCVSEVAAVEAIRDAARALGCTAPFHVEVDTGMGRAGFDGAQAERWGLELRRLLEQGADPGTLVWEGLLTHFHSADEPGDEPTEGQADRFRQVVEMLEAVAGWSGTLLHLSNSAAALRYPGLARALVRPGIFLYGGKAGDGVAAPAAAVALRARVVLVREVPAGATLGYGATYRAERPERWATLGIGYGDGLPRALGNRGRGLLRGRSVPIIGRISMDLTVVDITDLPGEPVQAGEVVTLVGSDGGMRIPLEEVAEQAGTISYEILTGLTPRLPRVWVG